MLSVPDLKPSHAGSVGYRLPRVDGRSKVSGAACFVDDILLADCWFGITLRSQVARSAIRAIELSPSFDWSDVAVVTHTDIPGENVLALLRDDQPVLAKEEVRYVGEPIALVAARTPELARRAIDHIRVVAEPLPPLIDAERSIGNPIRIAGSDNVFYRTSLHKASPSGAWPLDECVRVTGTYHTGHQEHLYLEPQGMLAIFRDDGHVTLVGSMQCPFYVDMALTRVLGHSRHNVLQAATGGGFGGKEDFPSLVACHAALLAQKARRPVKLIYDRQEDMEVTSKRHPARIRLTSWVHPSGVLRRLDADILLDGGAYTTMSPLVLTRCVLHQTGPYRWQEVHIEGAVVATNTPPNSACRGFGAPQAHFSIERHLDKIASILAMDPTDLRRKNLYREGDESATGQKLENVGVERVLEAALETAGPWPSPLDDPTERASGRGIALGFHGCGFAGLDEQWLGARVGMSFDASGLWLHTSATDIGQGSETTLCQIAADTLGIDPCQIRVSPRDTAKVPNSGATSASRTCVVVGRMVKQAATKLIESLKNETRLDTDDFSALAAARSNTALIYVEARSSEVGDRQWHPTLNLGDAYETYSWSCSVVDVDVDMKTGSVHYRRLITAVDGGRAINPSIVEGQIEGGSIQGLGWATCEELHRDEFGKTISGALLDYAIPDSSYAPPVTSRIVEMPYKGGPFGAKGIGEIPMNAIAAACAQAIERATGARLTSIPMTPRQIRACIRHHSEDTASLRSDRRNALTEDIDPENV